MNMDMNLICNKDLTTQGDVGKCECRRDMKWNTEAMECQVYLDVDCSKFTYDTVPSAAIQVAVEEAQREMNDMPMIGEGVVMNRTETPEETLDNSLLKHMNVNTTSEDDLLEAYCRDIDAYSFEFNQQQNNQIVENRQSVMNAQQPQIAQYPDPHKPPKCDQIPVTSCASVHQTKSCLDGFTLNIDKDAELRLKWATPYFAYRNRIEVVGVRPGCSFTGFAQNNFDGEQIMISNDGEFNRWVALADDVQYQQLNNNIESVQCVCKT